MEPRVLSKTDMAIFIFLLFLLSVILPPITIKLMLSNQDSIVPLFLYPWPLLLAAAWKSVHLSFSDTITILLTGVALQYPLYGVALFIAWKRRVLNWVGVLLLIGHGTAVGLVWMFPL